MGDDVDYRARVAAGRAVVIVVVPCAERVASTMTCHSASWSDVALWFGLVLAGAAALSIIGFYARQLASRRMLVSAVHAPRQLTSTAAASSQLLLACLYLHVFVERHDKR